MSEEYRAGEANVTSEASPSGHGSEQRASSDSGDAVIGAVAVEDDPRVAALDEKIAKEKADHRRRMKRLRAERETLAKAIESERMGAEIERLRAENARLKAAGSAGSDARSGA